jgi:hypothetical protein
VSSQATWGSIHRRIVDQSGQDKKPDPISKITRGKLAGGMAQVVEYLPSEHEALSSNSSARKTREEERGVGEGGKNYNPLNKIENCEILFPFLNKWFKEFIQQW